MHWARDTLTRFLAMEMRLPGYYRELFANSNTPSDDSIERCILRISYIGQSPCVNQSHEQQGTSFPGTIQTAISGSGTHSFTDRRLQIPVSWSLPREQCAKVAADTPDPRWIETMAESTSVGAVLRAWHRSKKTAL